MCAQVPLELSAGAQPALALLSTAIRPAGGQQLPSDTRRRALSARWRGLCFDRKHNAWRVRIFYAGKQRHVGRFKDDVAAARAYDKAAFFLYGPKAILNFGFQDVLSDSTPVPACIRLARQQAEAAGLLDANGTPLASQQMATGSACGDGGSSSGDDSPVSGSFTASAASAGLGSPASSGALSQQQQQQQQQQQHSIMLQGAQLAGGAAALLPAHQQQHILLSVGGANSCNISANSSCSTSSMMWHTTAASSSCSNLAALQPGMPAAAWQLQPPLPQGPLPAVQRVHGVQVLCAPPLPPSLGGPTTTAMQPQLLQLQVQQLAAAAGAGGLAAPLTNSMPTSMAGMAGAGGDSMLDFGLCAATAALAAVSSGAQLVGPMHPALPLQLQHQPNWLAAAVAQQQQQAQAQAHLAVVTAAAEANTPATAAMLDPTLLASLLSGCNL